jgi:hypothetical protein
MVQEIQEKRYETGRLVLEWLARHYYDMHQIRKAVGLMKTLAEWEGLDLDQSVSYLSLAGACYLLLDDLDESCKMYELMCERAALTVEAQRQVLRAHARMCIRDIRTRQQQLLDERAAWGLNEPRLCVCGKETMRLCSGKCDICSHRPPHQLTEFLSVTYSLRISALLHARMRKEPPS